MVGTYMSQKYSLGKLSSMSTNIQSRIQKSILYYYIDYKSQANR